MTKLLFLLFLSWPQPKFVKVITSDLGDYSYFILVSIKSENYSGNALVENDDLYYYLTNTKNISMREYRKIVKKYIRMKEIITLSNDDFHKYKFIEIPEKNNSLLYMSKNRKDFFNHYFKKDVLTFFSSDMEQYMVVAQLFKWGIPVKIDDETGVYVMYP